MKRKLSALQRVAVDLPIQFQTEVRHANSVIQVSHANSVIQVSHAYSVIQVSPINSITQVTRILTFHVCIFNKTGRSVVKFIISYL